MRKGRPSSNLKSTKPANKNTVSTPNWVEIAASAAELPLKDKNIVGISLASTDKFVLGKILMVLRVDDDSPADRPIDDGESPSRYYCLGSSCTKCKFPLMKSSVDEAGEAILCGVCGSKYSFKTGAMVGTVRSVRKRLTSTQLL